MGIQHLEEDYMEPPDTDPAVTLDNVKPTTPGAPFTDGRVGDTVWCNMTYNAGVDKNGNTIKTVEWVKGEIKKVKANGFNDVVMKIADMSAEFQKVIEEMRSFHGQAKQQLHTVSVTAEDLRCLHKVRSDAWLKLADSEKAPDWEAWIPVKIVKSGKNAKPNLYVVKVDFAKSKRLDLEGKYTDYTKGMLDLWENETKSGEKGFPVSVAEAATDLKPEKPATLESGTPPS